MNEKKPRHVHLGVDFGRDVVISGMSPPGEDILRFYDEKGEVIHPVRVQVGAGYQRLTKPPKALTRAPGDPTAIVVDVNRVLRHYDWVVATDTNTKTIGNAAVSVCACIVIHNLRQAGDTWSWDVHWLGALEFHNASAPPERVGWWDTIKGLEAIGLHGELALIVDSEMDNLDAFNDGSMPLVGDFVLPERVTMIYACGDRATGELIGNHLVATCDRIGREILQKVASPMPDQPELVASRHGHHGKHRRWYWGPPQQP